MGKSESFHDIKETWGGRINDFNKKKKKNFMFNRDFGHDYEGV